MPSTSSVIVSRLVLVVGLLASSGAVYWFLNTTFAPVEIAPPAPAQQTGNMRYDPRADVSKNPVWNNLRPLSTQRLEPEEDIGRSDPFSPVPTSSANGANSVSGSDASIYIGGNTGMPTPSSLFPAVTTTETFQEGVYSGMAPPVFPAAATNAPPEVYGR